MLDGVPQEALIALPYAYGKLDVHGRAALLYANALESFSHEVERLDASLMSIREGNFLKVLAGSIGQMYSTTPPDGTGTTSGVRCSGGVR